MGYFKRGADTGGWPISDYYEGDMAHPGDIAVPNRPSVYHDTYNGTNWSISLATAKTIKQAEIYEAFLIAVSQPVISATYTWNGGIESAQVARDAIDAAEWAGLLNVDLETQDLQRVTFTIADAKAVAGDIGNAAMIQEWNRRDKFKLIETATTQAQLDLIVW